MSACEATYIANAVAALEAPTRELWRPTREDQRAALEIMLASELSHELRRLLREMEQNLATRRAA
jgi:hypothetical protein